MLLQRHETLHDFYLDFYEEKIPADLLRVRPHPRTNSVAWNLWHIARAEDVGVNRFVANEPQVLNTDWMQRMNLPLRHHGYAMTLAEVDELNRAVNLEGLHGYRRAVAARTRKVVANLESVDLERAMDAQRLRLILDDEGVAHPAAQGLFENYLGRTAGRNLMTYGATHGFQHVGEIDTIVSLLGLELD